MELWGLKEGSYLFQLTVAGSDQRESTSNITVTVLSPKQTEGEEGGGEADPGLTRTLHPAPALLIGPRSSLTSFPSPRILPCIQQGGPLPWFLPPLVYYDTTEQICKSFVYGGCLGNKNNYLREEECKLACRNVQGGPL